MTKTARLVKGVPIRPEDVRAAKVFPDGILDAFNEEIVQNMRGNVARVIQRDVIARFLAANPTAGLGQKGVFDAGWLDVEPLYTAVGWKVRYHKPDRGEAWEAFFEFERTP